MTTVIVTPQNKPVEPVPFYYINDLQITITGNTGLTIGSGRCRDSSNTLDIIVPSTLTLDLTTNGVNGLDTGSLAASTQYYIYLIAKSNEYEDPADNDRTYTHGGLVSASATAPVMPSGYDSARLIGYALSDGSSHLITGYFVGTGNARSFFYDTMIKVLNDGTASSLTAIDLSSAVPPVQNTPVYIQDEFTPATANDYVSYFPGDSSATVGQRTYGSVAAKMNGGMHKIVSRIASSVAKIKYINSAASGNTDVWVAGYDYFI